jgi:hypothetical protein
VQQQITTAVHAAHRLGKVDPAAGAPVQLARCRDGSGGRSKAFFACIAATVLLMSAAICLGFWFVSSVSSTPLDLLRALVLRTWSPGHFLSVRS